MKEPTKAEYEAGRVLHQAWYNVGRAIAPPFDLMDKFDRLRWIETAKIANGAERDACAKVCKDLYDGDIGVVGKHWLAEAFSAIRARGQR